MMRRRSRVEWLHLVRAWRGSEQSAAEFAREHGVNSGTMKWWCRRFKAEGERIEPEAGQLVEVVQSAPARVTPGVVRGGGAVRLAVGANVAIVFDEVPAAHYLAELVRGVERAPQ